MAINIGVVFEQGITTNKECISMYCVFSSFFFMFLFLLNVSQT